MRLDDFPRDKHYRYLEAAAMAAFSCPGIGGRKNNTFRVGACVVYKKNILTIKPNSGKTHPKLLAFSKYPYLHAESNAILSLGLDNCQGATIYVVRLLRNNEVAIARPCPSCMKLIEHVGIKQIFYTEYEGYNKCFT